jgi:hypothetical protein
MLCYSKEVNLKSVLVAKVHAEFIISVVCAYMMYIFCEKAGAVGWFWKL